MTASDAPVDILLATYNGARFLPELLESLAAQSHRRWRLILRDDGSSDGSRELVEGWAAGRPEAFLAIDPGGSNLGAAGSFAALLAASDAPYFLFCDQDDVWLPDKISHLLALMQEAEGARGTQTPLLVHSDLRVVDEALAPIAPSFWARQQIASAQLGRTGGLLIRNCVTGCAMIGNAALRSAALPIPDSAMMHDWWCGAVAWRTGHIVETDRATVLYRQHGGNALGSPGSVTMNRAFGLLVTKPKMLMGLQRTVIDRARQAAALLERFPGDPDSPATRFCSDFARIKQLPFLARKRFLWRHGVQTGHRVFDLAFTVTI
ncbi:glycosyltransferase family 2 protein [Paralimibaculum aggregatum]|uniref:Glycosyltransferase family 2 protein n=1 Tax=Paralimibaculum aggregatum TaxID=3036245 RepID=A0ABQ6LNY4_9RHOB|nr:glycosyltransferase family 2 protein [Limibaculum sp. NKW23]GMG82131.1 glycosyltransferase family 2 protein [Limibaculum sp. NKW23]